LYNYGEKQVAKDRIFDMGIASAFIARGEAFFEAKEHNKAITMYTSALDYIPLPNIPERFSAYYNIGVAYQRLGDHQAAVTNLSKAIDLATPTGQIDRDYVADAYQNRAMSNLELKNYQAAIADGEKIISLYPPLTKQSPDAHKNTHADGFNTIGVAYHKLENYTEALANYSKALAAGPTDNILLGQLHLNNGLALAKLNRHAEAIISYDNSLKSYPIDHPNHQKVINNKMEAVKILEQQQTSKPAAPVAAQKQLVMPPPLYSFKPTPPPDEKEQKLLALFKGTLPYTLVTKIKNYWDLFASTEAGNVPNFATHTAVLSIMLGKQISPDIISKSYYICNPHLAVSPTAAPNISSAALLGMPPAPTMPAASVTTARTISPTAAPNPFAMPPAPKPLLGVLNIAPPASTSEASGVQMIAKLQKDLLTVIPAGNYARRADVYNKIGMEHDKLKNFKEALENYKTAIAELDAEMGKYKNSPDFVEGRANAARLWAEGRIKEIEAIMAPAPAAPARAVSPEAAPNISSVPRLHIAPPPPVAKTLPQQPQKDKWEQLRDLFARTLYDVSYRKIVDYWEKQGPLEGGIEPHLDAHVRGINKMLGKAFAPEIIKQTYEICNQQRAVSPNVAPNISSAALLGMPPAPPSGASTPQHQSQQDRNGAIVKAVMDQETRLRSVWSIGIGKLFSSTLEQGKIEKIIGHCLQNDIRSRNSMTASDLESHTSNIAQLVSGRVVSSELVSKIFKIINPNLKILSAPASNISSAAVSAANSVKPTAKSPTRIVLDLVDETPAPVTSSVPKPTASVPNIPFSALIPDAKIAQLRKDLAALPAGDNLARAKLYNDIGCYYNELNNPNAALESFNNALAQLKSYKKSSAFVEGSYNEQSGKVHNNKGFAYYKLGQYDEALKSFATSLGFKKDNFERGGTYNTIGMVYEKLNKPKEALENYKNSLTELKSYKKSSAFVEGSYNEQSGKVHNNKGFAYYKLGQYDEALKSFATSLEFKKDNIARVGAYNTIGMVYEKLNKPKEALENYKNALTELKSYKKSPACVPEKYNALLADVEKGIKVTEAKMAAAAVAPARAVSPNVAPNIPPQLVQPTEQEALNRRQNWPAKISELFEGSVDAAQINQIIAWCEKNDIDKLQGTTVDVLKAAKVDISAIVGKEVSSQIVYNIFKVIDPQFNLIVQPAAAPKISSAPAPAAPAPKPVASSPNISPAPSIASAKSSSKSPTPPSEEDINLAVIGTSERQLHKNRVTQISNLFSGHYSRAPYNGEIDKIINYWDKHIHNSVKASDLPAHADNISNMINRPVSTELVIKIFKVMNPELKVIETPAQAVTSSAASKTPRQPSPEENVRTAAREERERARYTARFDQISELFGGNINSWQIEKIITYWKSYFPLMVGIESHIESHKKEFSSISKALDPETIKKTYEIYKNTSSIQVANPVKQAAQSSGRVVIDLLDKNPAPKAQNDNANNAAPELPAPVRNHAQKRGENIAIARQNVRDKNYENALKLYNQILPTKKSLGAAARNVELFEERGDVYKELNNPEKAAADYKKVRDYFVESSPFDTPEEDAARIANLERAEQKLESVSAKKLAEAVPVEEFSLEAEEPVLAVLSSPYTPTRDTPELSEEDEKGNMTPAMKRAAAKKTARVAMPSPSHDDEDEDEKSPQKHGKKRKREESEVSESEVSEVSESEYKSDSEISESESIESESERPAKKARIDEQWTAISTRRKVAITLPELSDNEDNMELSAPKPAATNTIADILSRGPVSASNEKKRKERENDSVEEEEKRPTKKGRFVDENGKEKRQGR
jgi:tetratricopeptide (TPR) repeat protein